MPTLGRSSFVSLPGVSATVGLHNERSLAIGGVRPEHGVSWHLASIGGTNQKRALRRASLLGIGWAPLMSLSTSPRCATASNGTMGRSIPRDCRGSRKVPVARSRAALITLVDRIPAAPPSRMSPRTARCPAVLAATAAARSVAGLAARLENIARGEPLFRLVATTRHSAMPVSAENAISVPPCRGDGSDVNVVVASCERFSRPLPRFAAYEREREHGSEHAPISQLAMRQVHETRGKTGMAAAEPAASFLELALHRGLFGMRGVEACERRHRYVGVVRFVVRGPRERRIHDD